MDRRNFLALALAFSGSISLPVSRCLAAAATTGDSDDFEPLAPVQRRLLAALAEHIIPQTDTPGAIAAGVPEFIELMLARGFTTADRERFLAGLAALERSSREQSGLAFLSLPVADQVSLLETLEESGKAAATPEDPGFFQVLKELTLIGYYTSEAGATLEARYVPMAGRYDACVPLQPDDRAFADGTPLDSMI